MRVKNCFIYIGMFILLMFQSCGINSDLMLKTPKDYEYDKMDIDSANQSKNEYIIHVNDVLTFHFFTNKGLQVLDIATANPNGTNGNRGLITTTTVSYTIMNDSITKIPILNEVNLVGKTIREAELYLEKEYSKFYVDPFVQITVSNRRVIIFPGSGGDASVVYLKNNNTTLLEALALAGGITDRGRAKRIKLIREENGVKKVYLIDLSTIDGLQYTDLVVQNGDYIYVEPVPELGKKLLKEIAPIFSLASSTLSLIFIISKL